jgi:Domain of unknown function (DUF4184)
MPLTFAHPAAAVPLARPLQRVGVLSALIIGSMAPDFPYFVPLHVSRAATHSLVSVAWFCVPVGMVAYVFFHLGLKRPLIALLPVPLQRRLVPFARQAMPSTAIASAAVAISVFVGGFTHVAWDSFTHPDGPAVRAFPFLTHVLFSISGYDVAVFKVLQHASTVIGICCLLWWTGRWYRHAPVHDLAGAEQLSPRARLAVIGNITSVACILAGVYAVSSFPGTMTLRALRPLVGRTIVSGASSLLGAVVLYCLAWQGYQVWRDGQLSTRGHT